MHRTLLRNLAFAYLIWALAACAGQTPTATTDITFTIDCSTLQAGLRMAHP